MNAFFGNYLPPLARDSREYEALSLAKQFFLCQIVAALTPGGGTTAEQICCIITEVVCFYGGIALYGNISLGAVSGVCIRTISEIPPKACCFSFLHNHPYHLGLGVIREKWILFEYSTTISSR